MTARGFAPILIVLIILASILVGAGGAFLWYQKTSPKIPDASKELAKEQSPEASPTNNSSSEALAKDETANWKTYTDIAIGYTIKYPAEFHLDESEDGVPIFFKGKRLYDGPTGSVDPYAASLVIYDRSYPSSKNAEDACEDEVCKNVLNQAIGENWKKENVNINNAKAVKVSSGDKYRLDYYLANQNGSRIVRIIFGASIIKASGIANENQQAEAFDQMLKMLYTFKFSE